MKLPPGQVDEPPTAHAPLEIALRWLDRMEHGEWRTVAIGLVASTVGIALWRWFEARKPEMAQRAWPWVRGLGLALAIAWGLWLAYTRASLVDDAFITFRYADNWAHGRGPVFNPGEYVQGYTNFLWLVLVALGSFLTRAEPPVVALVLGPVAFVANILVVAGIGRTLARGQRQLPLAAGLLALNYVATQFATTGLETGAASLCVNLGFWALLARDDAAGAGLAGLAFTFASLLRLDQGLFQAVGLGIVAARTRSPRTVAAFLAPASLLVLWGIWARVTYGELLPNTFEAKASGAWDPFQAVLYAEIWLIGTSAWIPVALGTAWGARTVLRPGADARERLFAGGILAAAVVWQVWLLRLGGDFMYGRFYQSFLPLFLLLAERAVHEWGRLGRTAGVALAATALGVQMIDRGTTEWYIADEPTFYPVVSASPLVVDHHSFRIGLLLRDTLTRRDVRPVVATSGPGMVAYLSDLTTIDVLGLTDRHVARSPSIPNGRPGHAKIAPLEYLVRRKVRFGHVYPPPEWIDVCRLDFSKFPGTGHDWFIVTYNSELMRKMRLIAPEIGFVDFEEWLDRYVERRLPRKSPAQALSDLQFMDNYYFRENGPGPWREAIAARAGITPPVQ